MLKISLLFTKNTNFMGELNANSYDKECKIFRVLCLFEFEYMGRFSNLQKYIFKVLLSLKNIFYQFYFNYFRRSIFCMEILRKHQD